MATGYLSHGRCVPTLADAKKLHCSLSSWSGEVGTANVLHIGVCTATDFEASTYQMTFFRSGTTQSVSSGLVYPTFPDCTIASSGSSSGSSSGNSGSFSEVPELFPLPSATDIGTVFAWGFSLVLVSYLAAWGLGTVLNFLKRN